MGRSSSTSCCPGSTGSSSVSSCGTRRTGRRSSCSPRATKSATVFVGWTSVLTTISSSPSASSSSPLVSGPSPVVTIARDRPYFPSEIFVSTRPRSAAWRGEEELSLSPKEMALLELFLRHPGTVLSRTQIIDAVWDFAYQGGSNVVDQYVKYLRDKVDTPFGHSDIETVRGMGYRLRSEEPRLDHVDPPPALPCLRDRLGGCHFDRRLAVRLRALVLAVELRRFATRGSGVSRIDLSQRGIASAADAIGHQRAGVRRPGGRRLRNGPWFECGRPGGADHPCCRRQSGQDAAGCRHPHARRRTRARLRATTARSSGVDGHRRSLAGNVRRHRQQGDDRAGDRMLPVRPPRCRRVVPAREVRPQTGGAASHRSLGPVRFAMSQGPSPFLGRTTRSARWRAQ